MTNIKGVEGIVTELRAEKINLAGQLSRVESALNALAGLGSPALFAAVAS